MVDWTGIHIWRGEEYHRYVNLAVSAKHGWTNLDNFVKDEYHLLALIDLQDGSDLKGRDTIIITGEGLCQW